MLKLVLKTPKLLTPAFCLLRLGWIFEQKKACIGAEKYLREAEIRSGQWQWACALATFKSQLFYAVVLCTYCLLS